MSDHVDFTYPYDVIISHGPGCNDGATAAWCAWRTLPSEYRYLLAKEGGFYSKRDDVLTISTESYLHPNSPSGAIRMQDKGFKVVFVFIQPGEPVPDKLVKNKRVLILDLDMGDSLIPVVEAASYVLLSDHHASTPATLNKHSHILFDTYWYKFATFTDTSKSESGATLAWKLTHNANIPPFVEVVRIGDTWQWHEYPELHAKFVLKALHIRKSFRSFPDIEATFIDWSRNFASNVQKGRSVLEFETSLVEQIAKRCDLAFMQTNDGTVYNVAYTQTNVLHSEVGSIMKTFAQNRFKVPIHFCATWKYIPYKNLISVSLRDGNTGINLSTIARNIKGSDGKGGGHVEAAGFSFQGIENFHTFLLKSRPIPTNEPLGCTLQASIEKLCISDHKDLNI